MLLKVKSHVLNSINHLWLGVWYIIMNIAPVVDLEGAEPAPPPSLSFYCKTRTSEYDMIRYEMLF